MAVLVGRLFRAVMSAGSRLHSYRAFSRSRSRLAEFDRGLSFFRGVNVQRSQHLFRRNGELNISPRHRRPGYFNIAVDVPAVGKLPTPDS